MRLKVEPTHVMQGCTMHGPQNPVDVPVVTSPLDPGSAGDSAKHRKMVLSFILIQNRQYVLQSSLMIIVSVLKTRLTLLA